MSDEATFMVEDARIIFRNFSGAEQPMNALGRRNFHVVLTPEMAEQLASDGWAVKYMEARDEGDEDTPHIKVTVNYKASRPPRIVVITSAGRTQMTEDTVGVLDGVDIAKVDLICRAYEWEMNGKSGRSAYLKSMFLTVDEDPLERKYAMMDAMEE